MRLVKGFVLRVNPLGPSAYFFDSSKWENTTSSVLLSVLIWLGDILVVSYYPIQPIIKLNCQHCRSIAAIWFGCTPFG